MHTHGQWSRREARGVLQMYSGRMRPRHFILSELAGLLSTHIGKPLLKPVGQPAARRLASTFTFHDSQFTDSPSSSAELRGAAQRGASTIAELSEVRKALEHIRREDTDAGRAPCPRSIAHQYAHLQSHLRLTSLQTCTLTLTSAMHIGTRSVCARTCMRSWTAHTPAWTHACAGECTHALLCTCPLPCTCMCPCSCLAVQLSVHVHGQGYEQLVMQLHAHMPVHGHVQLSVHVHGQLHERCSWTCTCTDSCTDSCTAKA